MKFLAICFCGLIGVAGCGTATTGDEAGRVLPNSGDTNALTIPHWLQERCSECPDDEIKDLVAIVQAQSDDGWTYDQMTAGAIVSCENRGDECTSAILSCHMEIVDYFGN